MKLIYKIEYSSTSFYFKRLIDEIIARSDLKATTKQYAGFILIFVDGEQESVERFFQDLEKNLPYSMFIKKSYLIDQFESDLEELEDKRLEPNFEILTTSKVKEILSQTQPDFLSQILELNRSKVVDFGDLKLFLPNKDLKKELEDSGYKVRVLIVNTRSLSDLFVLDDASINLLYSIERPLLKLKVREESENISKSGYIYARVVNSAKEVELANALKNSEIDYLLYATKKEELKACAYSGVNLIVGDGATLYPKYDYQKEVVYNSSKEYLNSFSNVYNAVLHEHNLLDKKTIGLYFSIRSSVSFVNIRVPNKQEETIIHIPEVGLTFEELLGEISSSSDSGKRLIENLHAKFPYTKEIKLTAGSGFARLIEAVAKLLDLNSIEEFENLALSSGYENALKIDMKIETIDGKNYLDYRRMVQSIISYKMADVSNSALSFSFYEFLAEFAIDAVREISRKTSALDVVLCGDLFTNRQLFNKVYKALSGKYNIVLPNEHPMDYI